MSHDSAFEQALAEEVMDLRKQVTILKAERDEARRTRDEVEQQLNNLLARIHRDGGQHVADYGVSKAVEDAHEVVVAMHVELDRACRKIVT